MNLKLVQKMLQYRNFASHKIEHSSDSTALTDECDFVLAHHVMSIFCPKSSHILHAHPKESFTSAESKKI